MPYKPHVFADNPMDRGDQQRRDEDWLRERAEDPGFARAGDAGVGCAYVGWSVALA